MSLPLNFPSNRVPLSINTRPSFISKPIATHQPSIAISSFSNLLFPVATPNHSTNDGARHSIFGKIIINPSERITFLERKIMKIILNEGKTSDYVWRIAEELGILCNQQGEYFMKLKQYIKAEDLFLKAKQSTEVFHEDNTPLWENYPEWQSLRLSIFQNLSTVYKALKKERVAYELLNQPSKLIKSNLFLENPDLILVGLDLFFLNLACFAYKQKQFQEVISNAEISINFIRAILRNSNALTILQMKLNALNKSFDDLLFRKNVMLGYLLYMVGKSQQYLGLYEESQLNLRQAFNIGLVYLGERDQLTRRYSSALTSLNNIMKASFNESPSNVNKSPYNSNPIKLKLVKNEENIDFNIVTHRLLDDSKIEEELEPISPYLEEVNENNHLLNPQQRTRRSSIFKKQSASAFFERKVKKRCGCIDVHEVQMAKIDHDSHKILNSLKKSGSDCNQNQHHHEMNGLPTKIDYSNGHNHHNHHDHGHDKGDEEEILKSFCSNIINKALQKKIKNRHMNNHDLKKIYLESEQNLKKMKLIVDNFSISSRKDQPLKKVNILYSPNHYKIIESQTQREHENISVSFYKEKKPSIFTLLTQKTPYSKRIPLLRPFSDKNRGNRSGNLCQISEELKLNDILKTKVQMFMSTRPHSHRVSNHKAPEIILNDNNTLTKGKIPAKSIKTEDCIVSGRMSPNLKKYNSHKINKIKITNAKSNEDNEYNKVKESPLITRNNRNCQTIKIDSSSPLNKNDYINTNSNMIKALKRGSEFGINRGYDVKKQKSIEVYQNEMNSNAENENMIDMEEFCDNISEKSDNSSEKHLFIEKKDPETPTDLLLSTKEQIISPEKPEEKLSVTLQTPNPPLDIVPKTNSILKKNLVDKLIKSTFQYLLVNRLKKKPIELKSSPFMESPIHVKDFSLFNESNTSFRGVSSKSIDIAALAFNYHEDEVYFMVKDLLYNREILWQLDRINLSISDKNETLIFSLRLDLKNSIEKGPIVLNFNIPAIINEEMKEMKLVNEIWSQYMVNLGITTKPNSRFTANKKPFNYTENSLCSSVIHNNNEIEYPILISFIEKLSIYLKHSVLLKKKLTGRSWIVFPKKSEVFLINKRNYLLYRNYLHETQVFYKEVGVYATNKLDNRDSINFPIKNMNFSLVGTEPLSSLSFLSIYSLQNKDFNQSKIKNHCSQDFYSKQSFFDNRNQRRSQLESWSFKTSLHRVVNKRKTSYEEDNKLKEEIIDLKDAIEECKLNRVLKPFIREFYWGFLENCLIGIFMIKRVDGFGILKINFLEDYKEKKEVKFSNRDSDSYFEGIIRRSTVEIERFGYRKWDLKEKIVLKLMDFVREYIGDDNIIRKIEYLLYNLKFKRIDLMSIRDKTLEISENKNIHDKIKREISHNKMMVIKKQRDLMKNQKNIKIYTSFSKKFIIISEKSKNFHCFIYNPLSKHSNTYISLPKSTIITNILPYITNNKTLEHVWNSLLCKNPSFVGINLNLKGQKPRNHSKTRTFTQYSISNLGKCYIMIEYLQRNEGEMTLEFEISPFFSKYKKYSFVLTSQEIKAFFKTSLHSNENILKLEENPKKTFMKNLLDKCQNFYFQTFCAERGMLYKEIRLLINKKEYLKNNKVCSKGIDTIGQFFKRIKGEIFIFTIQRNFLLEKISILIYSCNSARTFQCWICRHDYEKIVPLNIVQKNEKIMLRRKNSVNSYKNYVEYLLSEEVWSELASEIKISVSQNLKLILNLNNYRGILQELLSQKIYILNKKELAFVEIFLIVAKKNKDISESIKSFRAWESKPFTFYLRITIIRNNIETFNDKINVYELLDLYILKKYPENRQEFMKMKHEFNQGIFKAISVFLLEELQVLLQTFGVEILRTKHFLEKIDGKKNSVEAPIQIYRTVLSIRPLQIVTIFYDKIKELFVFTVYNNKKSKMVESKITLRKAERLIPYIRHFLTLGLNDKLGVRILKDLNIKLLMNAYVKFN